MFIRDDSRFSLDRPSQSIQRMVLNTTRMLEARLSLLESIWTKLDIHIYILNAEAAIIFQATRKHPCRYTGVGINLYLYLGVHTFYELRLDSLMLGVRLRIEATYTEQDFEN